MKKKFSAFADTASKRSRVLCRNVFHQLVPAKLRQNKTINMNRIDIGPNSQQRNQFNCCLFISRKHQQHFFAKPSWGLCLVAPKLFLPFSFQRLGTLQLRQVFWPNSEENSHSRAFLSLGGLSTTAPRGISPFLHQHAPGTLPAGPSNFLLQKGSFHL